MGSQCCGGARQEWRTGKPTETNRVRQLGYTQAVGTREATSVDGDSPAPTGRRRALLIGCNYPGSRAELRGCINDVKRMSSLLSSRYCFPPQDVLTLTDDGHGQNAKATRANVLAGMTWLVEGAKPGDALFFHFSGHGAQQLDPKYMEEDGHDETILPTDWDLTGMIVDDEIFDIMIAPLPSGAKLTAVMDCCHSGTGLDLPFVFDASARDWQEEDNPCHSAGDVTLFSGCMDEQCSADASGRLGEAAGAMTTALCDTLEARPAPCPLSFEEVLQGMLAKLEERGFEQRPNLTASQRFDASNRMFSFSDGFVPNANPMLGRMLRKKKHPKVDYGGAFGEMLSAASLIHSISSIAQAAGANKDSATQASGEVAQLQSWGDAGVEDPQTNVASESQAVATETDDAALKPWGDTATEETPCTAVSDFGGGVRNDADEEFHDPEQDDDDIDDDDFEDVDASDD